MMAIIKLFFLIATPYKQVESVTKKNKVKEEDHDDEYTKYVANKPTFECRVEYVIPKILQAVIDITCWSHITKIMYGKSIEFCTNLVVSGLSWIFFQCSHEFELGNEEVLTLYKSNINIKVSSKENNIKKKQIFYLAKEQKQFFQDVLISRTQEENFREGTHFENCEYFVPLCSQIKNLTQEFLKFDGVIVDENVQQKKKGKKEKHKKKQSISKKIPGEILISGLPIIEHCFKYEVNTIPYVYCLTKLDNILTLSQAEYYKPLSITIHSVKDIPVADLKAKRINKLKVKYEISEGVQAITQLFDISEDLQLNLTKTYFTYNLDYIALYELIYSRGLKIQLIGYEEKESVMKPGMIYSSELQKQGRLVTEESETELILGEAVADIKDVLLKPYMTNTTANFKQPANILAKALIESNFMFHSIQNTNLINLFYKRNKDYRGYNTALTIISVSVRLGYPLTKIRQDLVLMPNVYNKIFIMFKDYEVGIKFYKKVCGIEDVNEMNYLDSGTKIKNPIINSDVEKETKFTGFIIDSVTEMLIFIEGHCLTLIQHIWPTLQNIQPEQGRVFYDSFARYKERSYPELEKTGIIIISLKKHFSNYLKKTGTYISGNVPIPAWRALLCLDQLTQSLTLKDAVNSLLILDFHCLLSLGLEFGVPTRINKT